MLSLLRSFLLRSSSISARMVSTNFTVKFYEFGDPLEVLKHDECPIPAIKEADSVLIKMLASPINPADINVIQGTYGFKPALPANAGLEGVGEIVDIGSGVQKLKKGDWVLAPGDAWGTWRQFGVANENELRVLSNKLELATACTLAVNPPTAYRMLKDFVHLRQGETVIQNGANSGVGQAVIQIARAMGLRSVNIIRDRPNVDELKQQLKDLGADYVVTEEELRLSSMKDIFKEVPLPKLALNCVGGKNCSDMMRYVANEGYVVTYGGMSKQPVTVSTSALIFKGIHLVGFWRTKWAKKNSGSTEDNKMYSDLENFALEGKLRSPMHTKHPLKQYKTAVKMSMEGYTSSKQILINE
ncbi:enoyl-[acyl-carrier-protein] reductase, mitochondrial-like [Varroa destructor]|uniref:Enoyl-[acyl-carrier-protein] reductase, mitochondrial n=1 Tax=Varroa destructor TaxID=109461 RepID=A0A7M7MJB3_VARDE|nr:enoyl-[acyl-carrier-protein] reductase, mitochondrial-like [Varroa destructor]